MYDAISERVPCKAKQVFPMRRPAAAVTNLIQTPRRATEPVIGATGRRVPGAVGDSPRLPTRGYTLLGNKEYFIRWYNS